MHLGKQIFQLCLLFSLLNLPAMADKTYSIGTEDNAEYRAAQVLSAPHPEIPPEMHEHCFKSCCLAKFFIDAHGKATVKLVSSTGNEDLDASALKTLRQWKFSPATINGEPVKSTHRVKVDFEVE